MVRPNPSKCLFATTPVAVGAAGYISFHSSRSIHDAVDPRWPSKCLGGIGLGDIIDFLGVEVRYSEKNS